MKHLLQMGDEYVAWLAISNSGDIINKGLMEKDKVDIALENIRNNHPNFVIATFEVGDIIEVVIETALETE